MTRALVTGATSGLGREAAVQLARRGWRVAVSGRRREHLEETARLVKAAGGEPLVLCGSVTDPAEVKAHYAAV
ncbi:MAG: SDR family NAD(P)-dependent oxidoreductase, partial [Elusimicrobia bacterium]|nr:SDR family NAD(P)-dependent oxidoreductase [Elusimicrobiota bacterium]